MITKKHEILTKMIGGILHFLYVHTCFGNQTNDTKSWISRSL